MSATCCVLHNILLCHDGYLVRDLTPSAGGLEESLAPQYAMMVWNGSEGMWVCDDTDQDELSTYQPPLVATPFPRVHTEAETRRLRVQWERVLHALVDHHEYCSGGKYWFGAYSRTNFASSSSAPHFDPASRTKYSSASLANHFHDFSRTEYSSNYKNCCDKDLLEQNVLVPSP